MLRALPPGTLLSEEETQPWNGEGVVQVISVNSPSLMVSMECICTCVCLLVYRVRTHVHLCTQFLYLSFDRSESLYP